MKFKKILISASAIAAGSGLLATVLTSCAKSSVDDKLKVELNSQGLLYDPANMKDDTYKLDFKSAIKAALTRSNNWVQFKNALADEVVYNWFYDRMAPSKDSDQKNANFRTSYDEWKYQIDKDYDTTVQNCKNKYGANWEFYLQNEYLAPLGGTEDSYKHAKLVEKIRADFISKVFAKSYFGWKNESKDVPYPHIFSAATKNIDRNDLRNPENWKNFGFYARAELGFNPGDIPSSKEDIKPDWLAKHPDGDYATIQEYVFNRWFKTEKPFFATAALFKYSNPTNVAGGKLDGIYDTQRTGVKLPTEGPNEAFPFFGAGSNSGTAKAVRFLNDLEAGIFATDYTPSQGGEKVKSNGTITIRAKDTDDSQSCLLVTGNTMFSALFTPYAMACGNLYSQMMGNAYTPANTLTQEQVKTNIGDTYIGKTDDFNILKNFFYNYDPSSEGSGTIKTINNRLDLNTIYPALDAEHTVYHCPLFLDTKNYSHFYGTETTPGIRYITNNIQVDLSGENTAEQPWVMELNSAGMHILTIDGYSEVKKITDEDEKLEKIKELVKFRLMQKQCKDVNYEVISTKLLDDNGDLKTYFTNNFTNIILEMATLPLTDDTNVFRTIESYKTTHKVDDLFLNAVWKDHKLSTDYATLTSFLDALDVYEETKKCLTSIETANSKIYSYRSKQIANAKAKEEFSKTIFENGLLAPFVYAPQKYSAASAEYSIDNCMFDYNTVNRIVVQDHKELLTGANITGWTKVNDLLDDIVEDEYIKDVLEHATVDGETGFCPQYTSAKNKTSNRIWYRSSLVDKFMYSFMGNKANTANGIKMNAYDYYMVQHKGSDWATKIKTADASKNAFATSYARSKVISGENNLATYAESAASITDADDFYSLMKQSFDDYQAKALINGGETADEMASFELWKATVMYLISNDKDATKSDFANFYTILNSKIGDDETAIVGYITKGYTKGAGPELSSKPIGDITDPEVTSTDYDFNPDVDNMFDRDGYAGGDASAYTDSAKMSNAAQWSVVKRYYDGLTNPKEFSGFLGIQTKANNQLDSASGLQGAVFDSFAKSTFESTNIETGKAYAQNAGCWFQFAGIKDVKGEVLKISDLEVKTESGATEKFVANDWFPVDTEYAPVRKLAKKIREYGSMDDLRTLAQTLTAAYDGRSGFASIADGTTTFDDVDQMRMAMLKLLPSKEAEKHSEWNAHSIDCFKRVSNVEAHPAETPSSYVFEDYGSKTSYKLLMTQLNKADALEQTITPTWDTDHWEMAEGSPITAEEFWVILFNMASESTVQQRAITEIVKTAFGDKKLIVYDAQLYNQFDSVWIKDWTKKTMGA